MTSLVVPSRVGVERINRIFRATVADHSMDIRYEIDEDNKTIAMYVYPFSVTYEMERGKQIRGDLQTAPKSCILRMDGVVSHAACLEIMERCREYFDKTTQCNDGYLERKVALDVVDVYDGRDSLSVEPNSELYKNAICTTFKLRVFGRWPCATDEKLREDAIKVGDIIVDVVMRDGSKEDVATKASPIIKGFLNTLANMLSGSEEEGY